MKALQCTVGIFGSESLEGNKLLGIMLMALSYQRPTDVRCGFIGYAKQAGFKCLVCYLGIFLNNRLFKIWAWGWQAFALIGLSL